MLGIYLIIEKPEYYAAFIGTGQMIDVEQTEKKDYQYALEDARKKGNKELVTKFEKQGEP